MAPTQALLPSEQPAASGAACISLVAYENVVWIDALLDNALTLTGARVALHLNALSTYDAFDLERV